MASGPITSWEIDRETVETVSDSIFWGSKITADGDCSREIKRHLLPGRKVVTKLDSIWKSRDITNKGPSSQGYGFSSGHVWMWEFDCEESWEPKNWCFWTVVLEKTLESPLDCEEIQPVHPEGDQSWVFIGRTDAAVLWPPHAKNWLIGKDPDAGRDCSGSLWWTGRPGMLRFMGLQRVDTTERLNWTELNWAEYICFNVMLSICPTLSFPPTPVVWHPFYVESKKKWYKWTYLQNRKRLTDKEWTYGCWGEGIVREFGTDMYTLLGLKWITNKDVLCSTRELLLCGSLDGRGGGGEWIHVYVWLSLFMVHLKLSQHF